MIIISRRLLNILTLNNKKAIAMALWPFIIFANKKTAENMAVYNHEKIHHRQQLELLIIPYYVWYFVEYWLGMIKFRSHDKAYRSISFEKEAYAMQDNLNYLKGRKFLSSVKYLRGRSVNSGS